MVSFGRVGNAAYRDVPGVYVSVIFAYCHPTAVFWPGNLQLSAT